MLAFKREESLKFDLSKSPSRISERCIFALLKSQCFATTLIKSLETIIALINVLRLTVACLKLAFLISASLKLHQSRLENAKLHSIPLMCDRSQFRIFEPSRFKQLRLRPVNFRPGSYKGLLELFISLKNFCWLILTLFPCRTQSSLLIRSSMPKKQTSSYSSSISY